nr:uncharacterized protein LOC115268182 [Aedes albopictus]
MVIRNRFKGRKNFVLFTNKKLDEKLKTVEDCLAINDRDVDEHFRFTSVGATHKVLTPTESIIESIMEYANKDLYSLKDAIKQLFTDGIITNGLQKYNAFLNDILNQSRNYQIRFKESFNDSLIFMAKVYKVLQPELRSLKPIDKPLELNIREKEYESLKCLTVEDQDFDQLIKDIKNLFHSGIVSNHLKKYENLLALILTTTANGQLKIKDTFNSDIVCKAELYKMLKAELSDLNKKIKTKQKLFDLKDSRRKYHSVLFYAEASDVREFFALLTLSVHQPEELESFIVEELRSWMRMWIRPDVFGKLSEDDDENAVKYLDDHFESTLKREHGNSKPYLNQQYVLQYCNKLRSKIVELYPELNDTNQLYINRILIFEQENTDAVEHVKDAKFNGNRKSLLYSSSDSLGNDLEKDDLTPLPDKTFEEMTDTQFVINLNSKLENYQCLVLTADPGIGKTELLQYVALEHQKCKSGAVFLFYLNRLQDYVSKYKPSLDDLKSGLSQKNIELIQNVLKNESNDHITILFDGYDEIHEKNRNRINNLFVLLLKSTQIQLIISVRNHGKKTLQSFFKKHKIQAYYFSLEPFNNENIFQYLAESWKENAKCYVNTKFNSYSKFLVETFYDFCKVPLMVKMMAEIYKQRFQQFKETSMTDNGGETSYLEREFLEVEHIYETFIEKCLLVKIENACNGIGQVDPKKQIFDGFYLDHQLLAIEFLDIGELKFIFKNPKYNQKQDCFQARHVNRFEKSILVKFVGDKVFFSHNSYAEYFVAKFLWDHFIFLKSIIKNVLTVFTGIRHFFIKIIEKNNHFFVSEITPVTSFVSKTVAFWACETNAVELLKYVRSKKIIFKPKKAKMLHIAIKNGSDKICSYLIDDCKVHPDFKYDGGLVPLHSAIIYGYRSLVHLLLQKGADIHIQNTEGWSALHYAVHHKQIAITTFLIDKGIDVNCLNKNKWNALHISCNNGDADLTKMLIQRGALLDIQTREGKTPLHLAAAGGHTKVVNILTEHLIKKCPLNDMISNAYEIAALHGHKSVKETLIEKFPKLAKSTQDKDHLLIHCAAQEGMIKKVRKLIDDGANVNALNLNELTALHLSSSAGHSLVVELLLENGASVNNVEIHGWTPLHFACQNDRKEVVLTLIKNGANIESLDNDYCTALHISALQGHCNIVDALLKKGANVNVVGKNGMTPLFSACQNGHKDVVQTLLKKGANINALSHSKWTALHKSASEGHCDIVNLLLNKGAKVNAIDMGEWTPLHWACQNGHKEVVEELIKRGANIDALSL